MGPNSVCCIRCDCRPGLWIRLNEVQATGACFEGYVRLRCTKLLYTVDRSILFLTGRTFSVCHECLLSYCAIIILF